MHATKYQRSTEIPVAVEELWRFHLQPGALELLSPPFGGLEVVDPGDGVAEGSLVKARVGPWPTRWQWHALHVTVDPPHGFTDVALRSPLRFWVHMHLFEAVDDSRSRLRDVVWFVPPWWLPGRLGAAVVRLGLDAMFRWRHRRTRGLLAEKPQNEKRRPHTPRCSPIGG